MNIKTVEYRRLRSFGSYENETIGATAEVAPGEYPLEVLEHLRGWVEAQHREAEQREAAQRQEQDAEWRLERINGDIEDRQRRLGELETMYTTLRAKLSEYGVVLPTLAEAEGLPF